MTTNTNIKPIVRTEDKKYFVAYWEDHRYTMDKDGNAILISKTTSEDNK